jgi:hypothetical protein
MTTDDIFGTPPSVHVSLFLGGVKNKIPVPKYWTAADMKEKFATFIESESKDTDCWSPSRFDGRRCKTNAVEISCLVLDFDKGHDPHDFLSSELWSKYTFYAHSTHSHTPEYPKFRAVFPFLTPCPAKEGTDEKAWKRLHELFCYIFSSGVADTIDDTSRLYYLPASRPGAPSWAVANEGELLDWRSYMAQIEPPEPPEEEEDLEAPRAVPTAGSRVGDEFNARGTWEEVLEPAGWQKVGRRYGKMDLWQRPGEDARDDHCARTGEGSAGDRFLCWSTSVPNIKPRTVYDKFGLYAHIYHGGDYKAAAKALAPKYGTAPVAPSKTKPAQATGDDEQEEGGLPEIVTNDRELRDITEDALAAIGEANNPPFIFARDGLIVRIETDEHRQHVIKPLVAKGLRGVLARTADWTAHRTRGVVHLPPPMDVVDDILALGRVPKCLPPLAGVSSAPVAAPDGSIRRTAGYDPVSRWYITDDVDVPKWDGDGASAAKFLLEELLADFPFADQASRANALGLVLLPYLRPLIDEPTPLHLVDAPTPGTGKSLLVKAALLPALGKLPAATPIPAKEQDFSKLLFSLLLEGKQVVFLDNLGRFLNSDALAAILTAGELTDRVLGLSSAPTVKVRCVLAATSNNGTLSEDIARRSVWIRLDAKMEDPEKRTQFKHPKILGWVRQNRTKIVSAALGMIEHWFREGQPKPSVKKGSFEEWCEVVGGVLAACQVEGFLANDKELKMSANETDSAWRSFYAAWHAEFAGADVTVKELRQLAEEKELLDHVFSAAKSDRGRASAFGRALSSQVGKVLSGLSPAKSTPRDGLSRFKLVDSSGPVDLSLYPTREKFEKEDIDIYTDRSSTQVHWSTEQVQNGSGLSPQSPLDWEREEI